MNQQVKIIWTIGHSTRTAEEFLHLLATFHIELLADVRSYPGSRRYPHFNKEVLEKYLADHNILYQHLPNLGGRRKALKDSHNSAWRNEAFRGYADYMETGDFKNEIDILINLAMEKRTAYMCSEAVWWRCHRSLISDYLKVDGWKVLHIINDREASEHPFTKPARVVDEQLSYRAEKQLSILLKP